MSSEDLSTITSELRPLWNHFSGVEFDRMNDRARYIKSVDQTDSND